MAFVMEVMIVIVLVYFVMKRRFDNFVAQFGDIPSESSLPFLGHSFHYMFKSPSQILKLGVEAMNRLGGTALFIMGFNARVFITDPKDVEELLSSRKMLVKADFYGLLKDWMGSGLLLSDGEKWFARRKIITPAFHFKILEDFVEIFDKHSDILVEKLGKFDGASVDIYSMVALCALDIICETSISVEIHAQNNSESEYAKAVKQMGKIVSARFFNIFIQNKWIFRLSPYYYRHKKCLKTLHDFTDSVIVARREKLTLNNNHAEADMKGSDDDVKRKLAFLDILLRSSIDGQPLSNEAIREEVDIFSFAGHDTTTSATSFTLLNLAKYPEIQQKAYEEIMNVIGDDLEMPARQSDLNDLHYLELVIKESMRLYPTVPLYGREVQEDVKLNGKFIPKKTNLIITAVAMNRSEKVWQNPNDFIPERFLAEGAKVNPFAYVPFSAGSRNCIGQRFAMLEMKSVLSKILRNFKISVADDYEPVLIAQLVLLPENGLIVNFQKRSAT